MPAYKDETRNNSYCAFYFEDWNGERKKKMKRGFETKKAAQDWERQFLLQRAADTDMRFDKFVEQYIVDRKDRLRENTWLTKEHIINTKILPYFKGRKLSEIQARDVIAWQNELMSAKDDRGKPYSSTYLKTVHNQLSAIFNHAVKYYNLRSNPAQTAGNMGSEKRQEMLFWTREEYAKFATAMMDKPRSFYAFEVLYWCGMPGLIEKYREVGNEFNNLAHYFNAGGVLDVDSGNRLTRALDQLKSLSGEVQAMTRNFRENGHTYPRKNP